MTCTDDEIRYAAQVVEFMHDAQSQCATPTQAVDLLIDAAAVLATEHGITPCVTMRRLIDGFAASCDADDFSAVAGLH